MGNEHLRKKRCVLHLLGTAEYEGDAPVRIVETLIKGLDRDRYCIHAWFLGGDGPLAAELEAVGAQVRMARWRHGAKEPVQAWNFFRILRHEHFAIVHQHFGGGSVRRLTRMATRAAIVTHVHSRVDEPNNSIPRPRPMSGADVVIATSRAVADWIIDGEPRIIYPGLYFPNDSDRPSAASPRDQLVLGSAGRLVPLKGVVYLVRALALLRADFPHVTLEIAGKGPEQLTIQNEVKSLGLDDRVTFLGWCGDILPVLRGWDIFVQPSLEEGFGIAPLTAMAAGVPVVASAVGGLPELIKHGQTGWLVPPGDPPALADALRVFLGDQQLRLKFAAAGRYRARSRFSAEQMVGAISDVYDSVCQP